MKVFMNTITKKILIALITIIMISNFIMPNYVSAKSAGDKLVEAFFYLIAYIGDQGLKLMQGIMIGTYDITEQGEYTIKYSPGVIFSGEVAALDINFINPGDDDQVTVTGSLGKLSDMDSSKKRRELFSKLSSSDFTYVAEFKKKAFFPEEELYDYGYDEDMAIKYTADRNPSYSGMSNYDWQSENVSNVIHDVGGWDNIYFWMQNGKLYKLEMDDVTWPGNNIYKLYECDLLTAGVSIPDFAGTETRTSVARELQSNISTWYRALRTIALVGLLSVLVYIGIKIILSSASSQDKAKYKNMLKDWIVAICILFVLHYIMAFILNITSEVNNLIKDNVISNHTNMDGSQNDELMTAVRNEISDNLNKASQTAGYTIMYLALVILTGVFTMQYLKRVIFMAFLTIIAPMIALTYPIDKIKDGKAQAFNFWLKEFLFNCLIQPVHLLLYTVLITSAINFAKTNVIYAIVALAFMVPVEKLIKDMFGMKSESPSGTLSTAVGGAMVMSMINKMRGKPPKEAAEQSGAGGTNNPNGIRTATRNGAAGQGQPGQGQPGQGQPEQGQPGQGQPGQGQPGQGQPGQGQPGQGQPGQGQPGQAQTGTTNRNVRGGVNALARKYIYGPDALKSHVGRLTGVIGAATAGTVGLAAQVADGDLYNDPKKALTDTGIAMGAGYAGGKNLSQNVAVGIHNIPKHIDNVRDVYDQGSLSAEEYQNNKFRREFFASDEYKAITQDSSINQTNIRQRTEEYLNNGVTDANVIREALQLNISANDYSAYSELGATAPKDIQVLQQNGIDSNKLRNIQLYSGDSNIDKIRNYSVIAQEARSTPGLVGDGSAADLAIFKTNFAANHHLQDNEAEKLYNKLLHYWN